jgi:hypothetical protein
MPLIRCSEQKRQTLEEFYTEFIPNKIKKFADGGTPMLKILELINATFTQTVIYGLTSHATLLLLAEDSSLSQWYVALNGLEDEYYIEYLMTTEKQPWPNAKVKGATKSLDELKRHLIIAMYESRGWPNSNELDSLYQEINISK